MLAFEMRAYLVTYAPVTVDLFTGMSTYNIGYIDQMYPAGKCWGGGVKEGNIKRGPGRTNRQQWTMKNNWGVTGYRIEED